MTRGFHEATWGLHGVYTGLHKNHVFKPRGGAMYGSSVQTLERASDNEKKARKRRRSREKKVSRRSSRTQPAFAFLSSKFSPPSRRALRKEHGALLVYSWNNTNGTFHATATADTTKRARRNTLSHKAVSVPPILTKNKTDKKGQKSYEDVSKT